MFGWIGMPKIFILVLFGLVLIAIGALFLVDAFTYIDVWYYAWRFSPVILILSLLFCPIISAVIASTKNRNAVAWFFWGMLLGPIAIALVLLLPKLEKEARAIIAQQSQQQQMMGPTIVIGGEKEYGNIDIESNPDKAEVEIDGSFIGTTPLVGIKLNAGEHLIKIVKKGYKTWERQLKVIAYSKIPIKIDLEKLDS